MTAHVHQAPLHKSVPREQQCCVVDADRQVPGKQFHALLTVRANDPPRRRLDPLPVRHLVELRGACCPREDVVHRHRQGRCDNGRGEVRSNQPPALAHAVCPGHPAHDLVAVRREEPDAHHREEVPTDVRDEAGAHEPMERLVANISEAHVLVALYWICAFRRCAEYVHRDSAKEAITIAAAGLPQALSVKRNTGPMAVNCGTAATTGREPPRKPCRNPEAKTLRYNPTKDELLSFAASVMAFLCGVKKPTTSGPPIAPESISPDFCNRRSASWYGA
eukprot:CAMPEP_0115254668 /NCGR_PEP_ID=MMETSP0270-20121206/45315_1 /TAXON_ID=71861 /ORGANISM="Scrippsiella trochoidea, Strain CCMP3099" /LENGTH=276 /DNA_ID=CAMNT_0002670229 /DNA_START=240 /DNA_END=1071 /DNA_ORIENTATION=+